MDEAKILELARKAGLCALREDGEAWPVGYNEDISNALLSFASMVAADAREDIAASLMKQGYESYAEDYSDVGDALFDLICDFQKAEHGLREATEMMRRLVNSSDYEMRDGDLARDLAEQFIRSRTE